MALTIQNLGMLNNEYKFLEFILTQLIFSFLSFIKRQICTPLMSQYIQFNLVTVLNIKTVGINILYIQ